MLFELYQREFQRSRLAPPILNRLGETFRLPWPWGQLWGFRTTPSKIPKKYGVIVVLMTDAVETNLGRKPEQLSADAGLLGGQSRSAGDP